MIFRDKKMTNVNLGGMKTITSIVVGALVIGLAGQTASGAEPLYEGLGSYEREVTSASPEARKYVNQGIAFLHGFNHGAAIRSFEEAARLDPACAMAHWGIAYAHGPHINFPLVPPPAAVVAWKELQLAKQHAAKASPVERDLIEALSHRYADPQPEDRMPLDQAYADAMRKVWEKHPKDADVGAWFAEALMDLRPWNQWSPQGEAQPGTEEVIATLDAVLKLNINHPLANHLYVHALEASPNPERAEAAADRLRALQPGLAHNVHMPTHIDVRLGKWQAAVDSNAQAVEADKEYRKVVGEPKGLINLYAAHNRHMLAFAAMMTGQRAVALEHINAMVKELPASFIEEFRPVAEPFVAMPDEVMVRFGMWDEILAQPAVDAEKMPFTAAFRHAAKAVSHAAKKDAAAARGEQKQFLELMARVPEETMIGNNTAEDVLKVVVPMVEGEVLVSEGKIEQAIEQLREAVAAEDRLKYDEPPAWLIPVRHALGAVLVNQGRFADAEQVYRADLKKLPNNGWSLYGLSSCLAEQGRTEEAQQARATFDEVWAKADLQIDTSCLCQPGEMAIRK